MVKNSSTPYGQVYVIATPIGNLDDISKRAIDTLKEVDIIAAEDTRHSKILLQHLGINTPLISLHSHNETLKSQQLLNRVCNGESMGLISDAGTPLISDPGFPLVRAAREMGIHVIPVPGCCAFITALSASGIPCQQFFFAGFLAAKSSARREMLLQYKSYAQTIVLYESTHRLYDSLSDIEYIYGSDFSLQIAKELTKTHEKFVNGTVNEIKSWLDKDKNHIKGEFVIILPPFIKNDDNGLAESQKILTILLQELPLKQAVKLTADLTDQNKNLLYKMALKLNR